MKSLFFYYKDTVIQKCAKHAVWQSHTSTEQLPTAFDIRGCTKEDTSCFDWQLARWLIWNSRRRSSDWTCWVRSRLSYSRWSTPDVVFMEADNSITQFEWITDSKNGFRALILKGPFNLQSVNSLCFSLNVKKNHILFTVLYVDETFPITSQSCSSVRWKAAAGFNPPFLKSSVRSAAVEFHRLGWIAL